MRTRAPFVVAGEHVAIDLDGAQALFTTRRGGVSEGAYESLNLGVLTDDDRVNVVENQRRVATAAGIPFERFQRGLQVHGPRVRALHEPPDPTAELEEADGQATSLPGIATQVLVADCLPVALATDGAVAMLHAGWRGLAEGVIAEGVRALRGLGAGGPVAAAIGPGIGPCCYEVGEEVHARFEAHDARRGDNLDLASIARAQLAAAGVAEIHDAGLCTSCEPELFFSHRRDAGLTGRQAGIAWRS